MKTALNRLAKRTLWATALALGVAGAASADGGCTLNTVRGTYVFAATGYNIVSGVAQPKAIVEVITFNGDGTLTVPAATRSINGVVARSGGAGTYTLDPECTGTIAFGGGLTFDIFTSRRGRKIWMIQTNPDTVFEGIATRTSRRLDDE